MQNDFETLFDSNLDIDEMAIRRQRGTDEAIIGDKNISLLMYENRIALAKGKTVRIQPSVGADTSRIYYDVPLICVVHSHPDCRFRWSRLMIDLSMTEGATILDMSPTEVVGDKPIEITTTVGAGLKFEVIPAVLSPEITAEYSDKRTVYYPKIVSSGRGFNMGYWDFLALADDYLHANKELHLLISTPSSIPIRARFNLRAKVKFAGLAGAIPLLARSGDIDKLYDLS